MTRTEPTMAPDKSKSDGVDKSGGEMMDGLDDALRSPSWGDYPLDSVFVRREDRTVAEAVKRINNNRYVLDPDFQRMFVWSPAKQSKLIESCLMRIPLPVFYVAEAKDSSSNNLNSSCCDKLL